MLRFPWYMWWLHCKNVMRHCYRLCTWAPGNIGCLKKWWHTKLALHYMWSFKVQLWMNLNLSRCTRLHCCYVSSVILEVGCTYGAKCGVCWLLLKSACVYPDTINWLICILVLCCQTLAISVLLLFYTIPFVRVTMYRVWKWISGACVCSYCMRERL